MRVIPGLAIGLALAARLGTADRRHMRRIGLLARAMTRLGRLSGFPRRPRLACGPCLGGWARFGQRGCLGGVPGFATRFARLVAALTVATAALRLAASAT